VASLLLLPAILYTFQRLECQEGTVCVFHLGQDRAP